MGRILHGHCKPLNGSRSSQCRWQYSSLRCSGKSSASFRDGQAPESFHVAFERVQFPSRKPVELVERLGGFEGEQQLTQLVGHRGGQSPGAASFIKVTEPFMAKADQSHVIS